MSAADSLRAPRSPIQVVFAILGIALGLYVLYEVRLVLLVLIFAIFFAYLILPVVVRVQHLLRTAGTPAGVSLGAAIGVVYLLLGGSLLLAGTMLVPKLTQQLADIAGQAPEYATALRSWGDEWSAYERARLPDVFRTRLDTWIASGSEAAVSHAQAFALALLGVLTYIPWLVLIPVLAFFLLKDADQIRYYGLYALPPRLRGPGYQIVQELNTAMSSYVRAQLLACLLIGVLCTAGFALLRVPYAVLLGVAAGILEFIPLVGPLVVAVVACVVAAVHQPVLALWVAAFLVVLRVAEDYVIYPRLMGHGTHLNPLTVILAVLMGAELGGVIGIFLAVPVAALLSVAYRRWTFSRREQERHEDQTDARDAPVSVRADAEY
jgi:predicted PurR-regulated permease PerM